MDLFTITIGASILIYILIGSYAGRSVKKLDDYFVAGRRAPTLLILGTLVASVMSTSIFMGEAAFTYDGQFGAYLLFPGIAVTGYMLGALFFGVYLRRSRAPTVADFFGHRFQSRRLQQFAGFTIILGLGGYLLIVTQGAALLLSDLTGLSFVTSLIIAWFSYTIFTMYAGSKGVIITDTLMFLLFMTATVIFVVYIVDGFGGLSAAVTDMARLQSKPGIASWTGIIGEGTGWPTAWDYVKWAVVMDIAWAFVYAVGPWQASRHLMARNEHVVLRAAILASFCVIVLQMLVYSIGGFMNLAKIDISPSETVLIWAAKSMVPELLGAFLLAGIVAAALSSASTFLSLVGFSVSNDIGRKPLALTIKTTRKIMLMTSLIILVCCYFFPPNIFWFMLFIGTVFASSWGPVGLMSVWSKRITKDAAFWGMVSGFFMNVTPATIDYLGIYHMPEYYPAVIGTAVSIAVIFIVSARGKVSREEKSYRMRLHQTPLSELDRARTMKTLLAPLGLIVYGCSMPVLLIQYYVIPYQVGTGEILADGSVNWSTPEAWITLSAFVLHVPLALLAMRVIWNRYNPSTKSNQKIIRRARLRGNVIINPNQENPMTNVKRVIRFETRGPANTGMPAMGLDQADFQGALPEQHLHEYFNDDELGLNAGVWTTTEMQEAFGPYPGDEMMWVLEGQVDMVDGDGKATHVNEGETFCIRNGIPISWKQVGFLRKFYITYADPKADPQNIDSADGGVIVLNAEALQQAKEKMDTTDPFVIKGDTPVQHDSNAFTNDAGNLFIGMWDSTAFESEMLPFPCYEFVQLLEGEITITEQDGTVNVFVAGDVFLVPEGTVCSWKTTAYVKKFYCMLDTSG